MINSTTKLNYWVKNFGYNSALMPRDFQDLGFIQFVNNLFLSNDKKALSTQGYNITNRVTNAVEFYYANQKGLVSAYIYSGGE